MDTGRPLHLCSGINIRRRVRHNITQTENASNVEPSYRRQAKPSIGQCKTYDRKLVLTLQLERVWEGNSAVKCIVIA